MRQHHASLSPLLERKQTMPTTLCYLTPDLGQGAWEGESLWLLFCVCVLNVMQMKRGVSPVHGADLFNITQHLIHPSPRWYRKPDQPTHSQWSAWLSCWPFHLLSLRCHLGQHWRDQSINKHTGKRGTTSTENQETATVALLKTMLLKSKSIPISFNFKDSGLIQASPSRFGQYTSSWCDAQWPHAT